MKFLIATPGYKQIYGLYERPPFPIIIDSPTIADVFREMRFSDVFMLGAFYGVGMLSGYYCSRKFNLLAQRLVVFHAISHASLVFGMAGAFQLPYRRLTGYWDNGLRWKVQEDKFKKFDNTSVFEANTIFKRFRLRSDD